MNTQNILVTFVAVIILGGIGFLMFFPKTTDEKTNIEKENYQTYTNDQFNFIFDYPEDAEIKVEAGIVKVQFFGPDAIESSEVTDGFTLFLRTLEKNSGQSLREFSNERYDEETERQNGVIDPEEIQVGDLSGFSFRVESELGSQVRYHILEKNNTEVYEASVVIADPSNRGYEEIVNNIEKTLRPNENFSAKPSETKYTTVSVAVLEQEYEGDPDRGCDKISFIEREVPETKAPLKAALMELFSLEDVWINETKYNFISKTKDTLSFEKVILEDGVAEIYLTGELSGLGGVCDNPRAQIQIEETALQFSTVKEVEIYLNGSLTNLVVKDGRGE